jgi:hypothetical protein
MHLLAARIFYHCPFRSLPFSTPPSPPFSSSDANDLRIAILRDASSAPWPACAAGMTSSCFPTPTRRLGLWLPKLYLQIGLCQAQVNLIGLQPGPTSITGRVVPPEGLAGRPRHDMQPVKRVVSGGLMAQRVYQAGSARSLNKI